MRKIIVPSTCLRTKGTNKHDFRKRKTRFNIRAIRAKKNRAIDLSISSHSCHSCEEESWHRLVDIVSFVPFVQEIIVQSTCRYRFIRAFRARINRAIDLSISSHSCHSCEEESCYRLVDIVSFVPFVRRRIVLSTCRYRFIRAIRAKKNRAIDLSISFHSCLSCKN